MQVLALVTYIREGITMKERFYLEEERGIDEDGPTLMQKLLGLRKSSMETDGGKKELQDPGVIIRTRRLLHCTRASRSNLPSTSPLG